MVGTYEGDVDASKISEPQQLFNMLKGRALEKQESSEKIWSAVDSRYVEINYLYSKVLNDKTHKASLDL